jgi:hypothetical protein
MMIAVTRAAADTIARAVLYEGQPQGPYSASSVKHRGRRTLGAVLPRPWCIAGATADRWRVRAEVVIRGDAATTVGGVIRFLAAQGDQRAIELPARPVEAGATIARFVDRAVVVAVERAAVAAGPALWRVAVEVANTTPIDPRWSRDDALAYALLSAHVVIEVVGGEVMSAVAPPDAAAAAVAACTQDGLWPALLGRSAVLAAPIVLPDRPELAVATGPLGPAAMLALHGQPGVASPVAPGDAVILRPRPRADVLDTALAGRAATVEAVECDVDGRIHVVVTIDDDPDRELGAGFPGHRFFFAADEVERR